MDRPLYENKNESATKLLNELINNVQNLEQSERVAILKAVDAKLNIYSTRKYYDKQEYKIDGKSS